MGSFSSKKSNKPDSKVVSALQPASFTSPFGNLSNGNYQPIESSANLLNRNLADQKISSVLSGLPSQFNVNEAYNNPYYSTLSSLYKQPIAQQRSVDTTDLSNQLSARNQLGSSYEAYQRDLLNRRYDQLNNQAENQARMGAFDAYNQSVVNALNTLQGLRQDKNASQSAALEPLQYGLNYQNNSAGLQSQLANYYSNLNAQNAALDTSRRNANLQAAAQLGGTALKFFGAP